MNVFIIGLARGFRMVRMKELLLKSSYYKWGVGMVAL